ncbi:ATP-dependent DNA ligase [Viridibacillus arvi]|uniref:ATP-dependent DNA ligase n=1 Tax=Viridibacillus arvi TaxID=263475 RepID=UPI0034CE34D9
MKEIAQILLQVNETSSKKEKESILASHKDNTLLKEVLNQIFNPFLKTNIAKKKLAKQVKVAPTADIKELKEFLRYIQSESSGSDLDIANIQSYIQSQPEDERWLLEAMTIKTLKFGFTESTINKAFGYDFIPVFDIMLADKWVDVKRTTKNGVKVEKIIENWKRYTGKRIIATNKLDGNRVVVFVHEDCRIEFYSREGHLLEGYTELANAFQGLPKGFVYDGEVLAINTDGLNSKDLFQKTSSICRTKGEKKNLEFHGFDFLPINEFTKGGTDVSCELRKEALGKIIANHNNSLVKYVEPLYIGDFDKDLIEELSEKAKANEEEGIMVQLADAPYQCKRTKDILKVKVFMSADVRCIDVYEGHEESTKGKLGGLVLDYKGFPVNVGGGYSAEEREMYWNDPSLVLGKIIEIKFFEEFENEDGELDLRFATFKTLREDKSEPSYY